MKTVHLPSTLDELWQILSENPGIGIYAGGTDILPRLRKGMRPPPALVCLERIGELRGVRDEGDKVFLGGCTTHSALLSTPLIRDHFPVLAKGLAALGSPHIRNMGTLGGNIATASPAGDSLPPLYVLQAEIELRNRNSQRRVQIRDFIKGPGKAALSAGEIVAGVWLQKERKHRIHHFEKVGQRNALAIAIVSMAAVIDLSEGGLIESAHLAWGSAGPTIVTSQAVELFLKDKPLDAETLSKAADLAREAVSPIDDVRATAAYRREVAGNLLLRLTDIVMNR
ncbi:MAG: xanthine dehydrogenase family protein subunit M [Desulfobacteraceae bacterium]|nr:MAG: xanthine dehydrogenase family protein subunit M [Desulfobacteraceae bacterium]